MCTMRNILCYILLICAVTNSFANNEEIELSKNETDQNSEKKFEEEAINDIEKLLKNMVNFRKNSETHNETEPKSIDENNETLMDRLDHVLKKLGIQRRQIDKDSITVVDENVRMDDQFEWDKQDMSFNARHRDLMKNLASGHRDTVKNRMIPVLRDTKFEDQLNTDKNFRFDQLMKNLDSNHMNAVKSRVTGDNGVHRTFLKSDFNHVFQLTKNFKVHPAYGDKIKAPKEELSFTDLLNNDDDYYKFLKKTDVKQDYNEASDFHMRASDKLHSDINDQLQQLTKDLDIKQAGESKTNGTDVKYADIFLHLDNNNEMDAPVETLNTKQSDLSYTTEPDTRTTDKLYSNYNNHLDELVKKMYSNFKDDSKETEKNNVKISDTLNPDYKNESHNIVKDLDVADVMNRDESTANVSSTTVSDLRSDNELDLNNNDLEYRPVIDIDEYVNKSTPIGKSVINDDMSDSNYQLRLLMKNLVINDRHDKQKIMVNLKQNTERLQSLVTKMGQNYSSAVENNDDNNFIEEASYRVLENMNKFNNANIPTTINLGRPVYQRLVPTTPRAVSKEHHGSRVKRSTFTQAGYTQDPDTCKTYNENLVKLWSNLSKFINVTEQPNEKALHNIAMMIQAYLDHQNIKSTSETYKVKHEGSRDKLSDVILKIRKLFEETDATPEKVTKIITKYLKPFYGDVENAECQQVNEESLGSSVELLYKNYLENAECHNDGEGNVRNKENLRKLTTKSIKTLSSYVHNSNSEYKPEIKSILSEDESYKDFHRGKMPRQRPTSKFRRVKRSRSHNSPTYRSGDQNVNDSEKIKARSKVAQKTSNKKLKKNSLKTDVGKGKCEKYAIRKFAVSLRPVMERYMALLECQLDNTLRSLNYDRVSMDPYYLYASKYYSNEDSLRQKKLLRNTKLTRKNTGRSRNISQRKSAIVKRYDTLDEPEKNMYVRTDEINNPRLSKYSLKEITGMDSLPNSFTDVKESNTNENNKYHEFLASPPPYDDYDGIYKTQSDNPNGFSSFINPFTINNDNKNIGDEPTNKKLVPLLNEQPNENSINIANNMFKKEEFSEDIIPLSDISDQQTDPTNTYVPSFTDFTKLRGIEELLNSDRVHSPKSLKSYESITEFLKKARDASLQTPEFAVPFALDSNKGYVELTHLVKYPKIIVYRPQFIVKNTMPYDDFLKTINNINMTNDDVRLMKIVRHLPDKTVKVLFETEDFESPLEVRNINDNRRSGIPITAVESRTDTTKKNNKYGNADFMDEDSGESVSMYRDEVHSNIVDSFVKSDTSSSDENDSYYASNSTIDSASNTPFSSFSTGLIPSLASGLIPNIASGFLPGLGSGLDPGSATAIGSKLGASIGKGLDTALSLGSALKGSPIHPSQLSSYISKFIPSYSNSQSKTPSNVNKHSGSQSQIKSNKQSYSSPHSKSHSNSDLSPLSNSNSHLSSLSNSNSHLSSLSNSHLSLLSNSNPKIVPDRNPKFENSFPSTTPSTVNRWWKRWKTIFKGKIKNLIKKMAKLAENIDHIAKL